MQIARSGPFLLVRLDHGEDILGSVAQAVRDEKSTMLVTVGLGMIHDFEIGYFDRGTYIKKHIKEPHELLAMQGSVASGGEPRIHIHVTVADTKHRAFGGHLISGRAWMSNEIGLARLEGHRSERRFDPERKVGILQV
jgi:hypothetical protein